MDREAAARIMSSEYEKNDGKATDWSKRAQRGSCLVNTRRMMARPLTGLRRLKVLLTKMTLRTDGS
jgi:hypothetical protein